jgi:serine/threonine protein kinase
MGQIYFGEDPQLKREVAVKVSSLSDGGEDPRFTKEAEVLAQLAHPNVVPIHSIGVDKQGRPYYAMKLVKGRTLQAVLNALRDRDAAALKDYPLATLLTIFRKVCDAMAFAHSKRILHRDLKPENIMVGEYGEVLVMDWGLAKVLGGSGGEVTGGDASVDVPGRQGHAFASASRVNDSGDFGMTMEGEVMGTPQYMSPEQAEGMVAELDERSDIYSLGGVLYAILTLRPPIDGKTLNEVLTKVKNGQISPMITKRGGKGAIEVGTPAAIGGEVPEALRAVTLKAMARDRAKRYSSVEEFAADLESYQNGFATRAEDAGVLRKLVLFVKRNKAVSALVSAMLLGAVLFTMRLAASEKVALANAERAAASAEALPQFVKDDWTLQGSSKDVTTWTKEAAVKHQVAGTPLPLFGERSGSR